MARLLREGGVHEHVIRALGRWGNKDPAEHYEEVTPDAQGKFPLIAWKPYQTERATKWRLIDWAFEYPGCNYGVITGSLSGIVCLDADNPAAEAAITRYCPPTPVRQISGSGRGQHHVYLYPATGPVPTRKNLLVHGVEVKGLDLRGDGGLFIGPGSLHCRTRMPYLVVEPWVKELLSRVPVFDMVWLGLKADEQRLGAEPAHGEPSLHDLLDGVSLSRMQEYAREYLRTRRGSKAGQGTAESYCFALAGALTHGFGLSPEEAEDLLFEWGQQESNTDERGNYFPWERKQIRHKLEDAARQDDPQGRPRGYLLPAWDPGIGGCNEPGVPLSR
jgi:hypothetical protein